MEMLLFKEISKTENGPDLQKFVLQIPNFSGSESEKYIPQTPLFQKLLPL